MRVKRSGMNWALLMLQKRKASSHPIQDRLVLKWISEPDQGGKEAFSSGIEMPTFRAVQRR